MSGPVLKAQTVTLSTGEVAEMCGVSPHKVCLWIDGGLLRAHRLPNGGGTTHRRVLREDLVAFMREQGLPLELLSVWERNHRADVRARRERRTGRGVPVVLGEWTEEDWALLFEKIEEVIRVISARHQLKAAHEPQGEI
jgi:excisionase family DNA binding protein